MTTRRWNPSSVASKQARSRIGSWPMKKKFGRPCLSTSNRSTTGIANTAHWTTVVRWSLSSGIFHPRPRAGMKRKSAKPTLPKIRNLINQTTTKQDNLSSKKLSTPHFEQPTSKRREAPASLILSKFHFQSVAFQS